MHNLKYQLQTDSVICADLYPNADMLYKVYINFSKHVLFCFSFVPIVSSVCRDFKVYDKNIIGNDQECDYADLLHYVDTLYRMYIVFTKGDRFYFNLVSNVRSLSRFLRCTI